MEKEKLFGVFEICTVSDIIDKKVRGDKLKTLLKKIEHCLITIEKFFTNSSKSSDYVLDIKVKFHSYGINMFQENAEVADMITGYYLYSQSINLKKIRCPKTLANEQKEEFKARTEELIKIWDYLGKKFSFDKFLEFSVSDVDNREKLRGKLQKDIGF